MLKFGLYFCVIFSVLNCGVCAPPPSAIGVLIKNNTLVENYAILVQDVKWFFKSLDNFVVIVDGILPNISTVAASHNSTSSLSVNTRLHLLSGLKHLLAGIRELSISVQQSFDAAHVRQLQHLKQIELYVLQGVTLLKDWFANLRLLLSELLRLHSYYAPELVLGKCVAQYLSSEYPQHAYYEYPMLLFNDILQWATTRLDIGVDNRQAAAAPLNSTHTATNSTAAANNAVMYEHVEQNEIPHEEDKEKTNRKARNGGNSALNSTLSTSVAVGGNEHAHKTKAWQKCFQLYTTETIMRQLKLYFEEP